MGKVAALSAMLVSPIAVFAFECMSVPISIRENMPDKNDARRAVFVGQVRKLDRNVAYIYVTETFTGPLPGTLLNVEGGNSESIRYTGGETYLVDAFRATPASLWTTSTCSHTRLVSKAADDLVALRAWKKGERVPCNVAGQLWGRDHSEHRSGIGVRLFGNGKVLLSISNSEGHFLFRDVPAGTYRLMSNGWIPKPVEVTNYLCPNGDLFPAGR